MANLALKRQLPVENVVLHVAEILVSARPLPPRGRFLLRGDAEAANRCGNALGVSLPTTANRASVEGKHAALWLGPDEWLLLCPDVERDWLAEALSAALGDMPHSLVDIAHRQIAIEVRGPQAAALLNGCVLLDLHEAAFPVNAATRTIFAKAEIVLWRTGPDSFQIEVWRSFAPYISGLLGEASRCLPVHHRLYSF